MPERLDLGSTSNAVPEGLALDVALAHQRWAERYGSEWIAAEVPFAVPELAHAAA